MTLVDQHASTLGVADACRTLGISWAPWYRRRSRSHHPSVARRSLSQPRRLSDAERKHVSATLCSDEFFDRAPSDVYAISLKRGDYLSSVRTMYRILVVQRPVCERRRVRPHPAFAVLRRCATATNELWCRRIGRLSRPRRTYFSLHAVLDVFSRYVMTWPLAEPESPSLVTRPIEQAIVAAGIDGPQLMVQADRGAPMTSGSFAQLLADRGVERSHSRPRVSNDKPYSEPQFKTMKSRPTRPEAFRGRHDANDWSASFKVLYYHEHRHEGIGFSTLAVVHFGRHLKLECVSQTTLAVAYAARPKRFVNGRPTPPAVPRIIWIIRSSDVTVMVPDLATPLVPILSGEGSPYGEQPRHRQVEAPEASTSAAILNGRETRRERPPLALPS